MRLFLHSFSLFVLLAGIQHTANGQLFNLNPPTITGQRPTPLITEKNTPITIAFQNLRVSDPDILVLPYPQGYTLTVFAGNNYTLNNTTVTPDNNFSGTLTVQVQVNDGKFDSNIFDLTIDVLNIKPKIKDQEDISIKEGSPFTLLLSHLKVEDDDNVYPDDFRLAVYDGPKYSVSGTTITPDPGFTGKLNVLVSVNDGHDDSDQYEVTIEVKENIVPVIKGQVALSTNQGKKITLELGHLTVDDADNAYPEDFSMQVFDGNNYTVSGTTVTPNLTFSGTLKVPVTVRDGIDESKKFEVKIDVLRKNNVAPQITGQDALVMNEDEQITLTLSNLDVTDPDNVYPDDFILKIPQGAGVNYSATGNKITPNPNYNGVLSIPIRVNDGLDDSDQVLISITVTPVNDPPVIAGQDPITIPGGRSTLLDVSRLKINDPDNQNPSSFTLKILPGANYTATGNSITPAAGFTGTLTVKIVVNDGVVDSAPFNLKVSVVPPGSRPLITGQQPLIMNEDESLTLKLDDILVTDEDNKYPVGFTLKILPGAPPADYTYQGRTVTPKLNMNGVLTVNIIVNDGNEDSPPFPLKIYVIPVNDAPTITQLETILIPYEPGSGSIAVTEEFKGMDVDNSYLSFAEVGFSDSTYQASHDRLLFENTDLIRGIYDPAKGILSLIGTASIEQYDSAIRSIQYNYFLTLDEQGNQTEVLPGYKRIYFTLNDGQLQSQQGQRIIQIESSVELDIPNAFTPNGDTSNDTWRVQPIANTNHFDKAIIKVYNKKGLLIYEAKGFETYWDGSFNGEMQPVDTYFYTIDLKLSYTKKTYKGTVTILR